MRFLSSIRAAPAGALVALAAWGLGGCISTATYGTGQAPEMALLSEATGGMLNKLNGEAKPQIDYEPRAPLVIPPAAQLPEPSPAPAELAAGAWPVEETSERELSMREGDGTDRRAMSPEYVRRMGALGGVMNSAENRQRQRYERDPVRAFIADHNSRDEFQAALAEADGLNRTERRYLTDPPSHYRQPAEGAPADFEDIKKKKGGGAGSFFSRLFGGG